MAAASRLAQRRLAIGIAAASLLFQAVMSCFHAVPSAVGPWATGGWGVQKLNFANLGAKTWTPGLFVCSSIGARSASKNVGANDSRAGPGSQAPDGEAARNCLVCIMFSETALAAPVFGPALISGRREGGFAIPRSGSVPGGFPVEFVNSRGPPWAQT